ncbi:GreA/GreB family elongation factor [Deinococcus maricopensis]|uniref:GreA/GreB family elongation factor n=1 Tax=Deinococcus maricopensis (strain DSM 21211 / LMG 22137 / NRRL B-23946 / LB-34) TaxID=709986 RepID=E8U8I1_DEIML|nr:GreA/GreB family elongation factor [Deinococcus maricopensis]ADV67370.1 GreA/GreB family elongation factor [Deinococcus maricopensis DSM 21211]
MASPIQVTAAGLQRLQGSLDRERERAEEARRVLREQMEANEAESLGLTEAQQHLAAIEARIEELEGMIADAEVLPASTSDAVALGSTLTLLNVENGQVRRVRLVSPVEATGSVDGVALISTQSPVGAALLGRRVGETFSVRLGGRTAEYQVRSLEEA